MYCQSCGAPMTLYRERDYFYCEYCGSYHFPNPTLDGLRLLGEAPDGLKCPVCRTRMQLAAFDEGMRGHHCVTCRGILLNRFDFRDALTARRARAIQPPDAPIPLDRTQLERRVRCPRCGQRMETHPYLGPGNIVIDTCNTCNLIWLDGTELQRAVNAPGSDRGSAHQPSRANEAELLWSIRENERKRRKQGDGSAFSLTDLLNSLL